MHSSYRTARRFVVFAVLASLSLVLAACGLTDAEGNKFQVFFYEEADGAQNVLGALVVGADGLVRAEYQAAGSTIWQNVSTSSEWTLRVADDADFEPGDVLALGTYDSALGALPVYALDVPEGETNALVQVCALYTGFEEYCMGLIVYAEEESGE